MSKSQNRYAQILIEIFASKYHKNAVVVPFSRSDIKIVADKLKIELPKNLGDVIYSYRYRNELPKEISGTAPEGKSWIIEGKGRANYAFKLSVVNRIEPRSDLIAIKIPDSTPEIISKYALNDEQALLAVVRYNRLIDIFLGLTTYSLQNHLRTTVNGIGQIEIDELYVGVSSFGAQFIIPVQAKGGNDRNAVIQTSQDFAWCAERLPHLTARAVSVQFMSQSLIAMFELCIQDEQVKIARERHYKLVAGSEISNSELDFYKNQDT